MRSAGERRRGHLARPVSRRFSDDRMAVSPVIGSILVLAIMVLSMAGIMLWGLPAIEGLQEESDFSSVVTQLSQTNADLRTLRDPENTRVATISLTRGSLSMSAGTRWAVTAHTLASFSPVAISGYESNTGTQITVTGVPETTNVRLERALGGTFTTIATSATCSITCNLDLGTYRVADNTTRIQFKVDTTLRAETWIFDAGRITYKQSETDTYNRVHLEMGALFTQEGDAVFLSQAPTWKEPDYDTTPKDASYLIRVFQLDGDSSASGKGRHTLHASLIDNYGITRGRPILDNTYSVRLQVDDGRAANTPGLLEEAFCNYFDGLDHYTVAAACDGGAVSVLFDPPDGADTSNGKFQYHLNQATVSVIVK